MNHRNLTFNVKKSTETKTGRIQGLSNTFYYKFKVHLTSNFF